MNMRPKDFQVILDRYPRVALAGAISSGKSLLLDGVEADRVALHSDKLRENADFKDAIQAMVDQLKGEPRFIAVGMLVPHAMMRGLEVDAVVWLNESRAHAGPSTGLREIIGEWSWGYPTVPVYYVDRALREEEE